MLGCLDREKWNANVRDPGQKITEGMFASMWLDIHTEEVAQTS